MCQGEICVNNGLNILFGDIGRHIVPPFFNYILSCVCHLNI